MDRVALYPDIIIITQISLSVELNCEGTMSRSVCPPVLVMPKFNYLTWEYEHGV